MVVPSSGTVSDLMLVTAALGKQQVQPQDNHGQGIPRSLKLSVGQEQRDSYTAIVLHLGSDRIQPWHAYELRMSWT